MNLDQVSAARSAAPADLAVIKQSAAPSSGPKSNATRAEAADSIAAKSAPSETVRRQFQLPVRVGGWTGIHAELVLPQLADRAEAAGVEITLEVADKHWWKGTQYTVHVEGAADNVDRFIKLTQRDPFILA